MRRVERLIDMLDEVEAASAAPAPDAAGHQLVTADRSRIADLLATPPARVAVTAAAVADVQSRYTTWTIGNSGV